MISGFGKAGTWVFAFSQGDDWYPFFGVPTFGVFEGKSKVG
jgi:hypothetical protein